MAARLEHGKSIPAGLRLEILAVGDNENDIEMMGIADVGFAMGNGAEVLKHSADVVLPDRQYPCVREMMDWIRQSIERG